MGPCSYSVDLYSYIVDLYWHPVDPSSYIVDLYWHHVDPSSYIVNPYSYIADPYSLPVRQYMPGILLRQWFSERNDTLTTFIFKT